MTYCAQTAAVFYAFNLKRENRKYLTGCWKYDFIFWKWRVQHIRGSTWIIIIIMSWFLFSTRCDWVLRLEAEQLIVFMWRK